MKKKITSPAPAKSANLWNQWLAFILDDLRRDYESRHKRIGKDPDEPAWVARIEERLEKMMFPVGLRNGQKPTARTVGVLLGQTYGFYGWIVDCIKRPNSALSERFHRTTKDFLAEDYSAPEEEELRGFFDEAFTRGFLRFQHVLKRALCLASERPFTEAAEFFDGFASAVSRRAGDDTIWTDNLTTAAAYYVLSTNWEFVANFPTVTDLHIYLQHKLGRAAAGDLDRTRTLAKRIGIKLAPRGRPSPKWAKVPQGT